MSTVVLSIPNQGVWVNRLTETPPHPLDSFVEGIRNGSHDAFGEVYNALVDDLASFAFGLLSNRRTAEDVVQQAFLELVKAAPKLKGDGRSLRAWLFRSVRFGCLDEYRRRSRHPETAHEHLPEQPVVDDVLIDHLEPDLERALNSLSVKYRTVVLLKHVVGLSGEEIADVIGSTRRGAYAVLQRAESKLREQLDGAT